MTLPFQLSEPWMAALASMLVASGIAFQVNASEVDESVCGAGKVSEVAVQIDTDLGPIVIEVYEDVAPQMRVVFWRSLTIRDFRMQHFTVR